MSYPIPEAHLKASAGNASNLMSAIAEWINGGYNGIDARKECCTRTEQVLV